MNTNRTSPSRPSFDVTLREVRRSDVPRLHEFESDPAWCAMAMVRPRSIETFQAVWTKIFQDWDAGVPGVVQRVILADGELCGTIGCRLLDGRQVVGYGLCRSHWGRGIASHALALFLEEIPMRPLYATAAASNIASIRVLTKQGFVFEARRAAPETERGLAREEVSLVLAG